MISQESTISLLRRALLFILVLGNVGTIIELVLLKHTDGIWQLTPLLLNALTLVVIAWYGISGGSASLRALQWVMVLCLLSGGIGAVQHFLGNIGYAHDSNPSLAGAELYKEAVMGSTPTLAPGTMILLALVGLVFAFRHPGLRGSHRDTEHHSERNAS